MVDDTLEDEDCAGEREEDDDDKEGGEGEVEGGDDEDGGEEDKEGQGVREGNVEDEQDVCCVSDIVVDYDQCIEGEVGW